MRWLLAALGVVLIVLIALGWPLFQEIRKAASDDPTVWEPEMQAFDAEPEPPAGVIVFTGSSSIRLWDTLEEDMAPLPVLQRGFGGAKISDVLHYLDRLVIRYQPRAVVMYAGTNDMNAMFSAEPTRLPEDVLRDFRAIRTRLREALPETPLYYLAMKPNVMGPDPKYKAQVNDTIAALAVEDPGLHFIDASAGLRSEDGSPNTDLLMWDRLHLNDRGYEVWGPPIRERLLADLGTPE